MTYGEIHLHFKYKRRDILTKMIENQDNLHKGNFLNNIFDQTYAHIEDEVLENNKMNRMQHKFL